MDISKNLLSERKTESMGTVQRYFRDIKMGTIKSDTLDSYPFHLADWSDHGMEPVAGQRVTFEVKGNRAVNVEPDPKD